VGSRMRNVVDHERVTQHGTSTTVSAGRGDMIAIVESMQRSSTEQQYGPREASTASTSAALLFSTPAAPWRVTADCDMGQSRSTDSRGAPAMQSPSATVGPSCSKRRNAASNERM
jgi:hypothetical protein